MTEAPFIHVLSLVWKWLVAPVAIVGWWMFKKRDAEMQRDKRNTQKRLGHLERRMMQVEKESAVIHSKINDIRDDNSEIKQNVRRLTDKLLK